MNVKKLYKLIFFSILVANLSCVEEFPLVTETFEDVLVIEATITDELKKQEIKLTRTVRLESDTLVFEADAQVRIETSLGNLYPFSYTEGGVYTSNQEFQAEDETTYQLFIETANGKSYTSGKELLAPKSEINNLYANVISNNGEDGIQVLIDSKVNSNDISFFRYEYEETYKIVAPIFSSFDLEFFNVSGNAENFSFNTREVIRPIEEKTCYTSFKSNNILITSTNGLTEQNISGFPIRFIPTDDPVIRERYSILVKQFTQSFDANNFYKILKELGGDESLLIDSQPGFIQGNVFPDQDSQEKVLGFFDVSSVTSQRIYFNYENFDIEKPPYFFDCDVLIVNIGTSDQRVRLFRLLNDEGYKYLDVDVGDYYIVNPPCGNCTSFSSSIKPEFWED